MIKKLKQTLSERVLLIFVIALAIIFFGSFITIKNKCLFVKNYDPKKINFVKPKNIIAKVITNINKTFSDIVCFNFFII